jgi:hypothetical protein
MRTATDSLVGHPPLNPYLKLGLQRNPFILESSAALSDALWIDRGWSTAPKPQAKLLIQFIGVKGAGKTSHLKYWQAQTGGPYCHYPPGWKRFKMPPIGGQNPLAPGEILYWDEADRIPFPYLLAALTTAAHHRRTIAIGTHVDLGWVARLAGLDVKRIAIAPFTPPMLLAWAHQRIESVRLPHQPCRLRLNEADAGRIVIAAQGSWREAADELHIWAAQQAQIKH